MEKYKNRINFFSCIYLHYHSLAHFQIMLSLLILHFVSHLSILRLSQRHQTYNEQDSIHLCSTD